MLVGDPPHPPGRVVCGHRGHGVDSPCLRVEHDGRSGVSRKSLRPQACDLLGQGRLDGLLQAEVDVENDVVAAYRATVLTVPTGMPEASTLMTSVPGRPRSQSSSVASTPGLTDHVVGAVAVLRQRVQLGRVDVARIAEHLRRGVAVGVGPLRGEVDRNPGEQALVLGQIDDDRLCDPDRYRHRLVWARLRIGERRRDVATLSPSSAAKRPMTAGVASERLRVTTGSTWSPTRTCPPRAMIRPRAGVTGTVCCLKDERGVAVVRAVKDLQRPEAHHDGRESHHDDQTHDREAKAEAGALLPALLFAFLLLEALQRARAHDPCPVPVTLFVCWEIGRVHRSSRVDRTGRRGS